ncbi:hypothetical protein FA15DRAFT_581331 [Coprinopsis marcescibilis]|uniref:Shr3 amino acid permease chaperone n=1 Tax=Coprinopsis marcescibilis TaxID=230819 RepID=A0A5C3LB24_COPMA|nr:hypothetical protein FA15DRAFT_581331 [Coprinopsis marcescibilis]
MGVRAGVVVCVTSFLLGSLFTHWIADSLTLWKSPVTDEHLWIAANYYSILAKGPSELLQFLVAVVVLGGSTLLWSLNDLKAENLMFDGGSIFLFGTTIAMYLHSVLPTIASDFTSLPTPFSDGSFPQALRNTTLELASNHLVCSVALTGVLALQAGRYWAERADEDDDDFVMVEAHSEATSAQKSVPVSRATSKTPDSFSSDDREVRLPVKSLRIETLST